MRCICEYSSTALLTDVVRPPGNIRKRNRRRGPRSSEALIRRSLPRRIGEPVFENQVASVPCTPMPRGGDPCESGSYPPSLNCSFTIFHCNIRGFLCNSAELEAR